MIGSCECVCGILLNFQPIDKFVVKPIYSSKEVKVKLTESHTYDIVETLKRLGFTGREARKIAKQVVQESKGHETLEELVTRALS